MRYLIGIDDTDILESNGTGHRARQMAEFLSGIASPLGITHHQLLVVTEIPYTSHNSSGCILVEALASKENELWTEAGREFMLRESAPGSDAGLCLAAWDAVTPCVRAFGVRAKQVVLSKLEAEQTAEDYELHLEGLTDTGGGMIGALAAVSLRHEGNDGRFLWRSSNMNGSSFLKTTSRALPVEWMRLCSKPFYWSALVRWQWFSIKCFAGRWGLPGHHGIEWIAIVLIGRASSRLGPAGSLVSMGTSITSALPIWGMNDPFIWINYMLPGPIADMAFRYLPRYAGKIWWFMFLGGLAHITKPIFRLGITVLSGCSFGSFRYGVVYPIASHFLYGLIGSLLGALIVLGTRSISKKSSK